VRDGKLKSLGRLMLSPLLGRERLQGLFGDIHEISLAAMGYGEGANPAASGEGLALSYVESQTRGQHKATGFRRGRQPR
jgi:hypothetical protein